jgi:hypothetical protein
MKKFTFIDQVYNEVKSHMPIKDRLSYCRQLMIETQLFVQKNSAILDTRAKHRYAAIIHTAQQEIKKLISTQTEEN